jgi:hypothetical protein
MISGISGGAGYADLSRSIEALSALLKGSSEQAMAFAEKLLRVDVQQTIQDASVGTRIDTTA